MQTKKMSLANMQGKLSRAEMKNVMAGSGNDNSCNVYCGTGSGQTCSNVCTKCDPAGNATGSGPGQDKICVRP